MAAGARWSWTLVLAALFVGAGTVAVAQSAESGSLSGSLTDLHSLPLGGVDLIVRNQATGAELRATTAKNGSYRFSGLDAGEYTLQAISPRLGQGRLEAIQVIAGHEARVQAAMEFEPLPPQTIQVVFHKIDPQTPVLNGTLAAEPLQQLALGGRRWQEPVRQLPATAAPALSARVPAEEMRRLPLAGRPWLDSVREAAAVAGPAVGLKGSGLAVSESEAGTVQTTLQSEPPQPSPTLTAFENAETAAQVATGKVSGEQLQALPVSGRRWQDFVLDTSQAPAGAAASGSMSGTGSQTAETTVDGASTKSAFGSPSSAGQNGMGHAWAGGRGFALSEAAVREVQTAAGNVEAQVARAGGGHMNVETQRGVNGLHGQGFYYDRQNTWGAKNPFTQWVKETAPATLTVSPVFTAEAYTPPDHETTWGIGVGSQIRRDKLFWFAALDAYQRNDPGLAAVRHPDKFFAQPSNDQMQVLSARLGLSSSNPVAAGLAAYSKMLETLDGLLGPAARTATQWTGFARIDWEPAERHRLTLEAISARWNSPGGGLTRVSETNGSNSFGSSKASEQWLLGRWEAFVTPNLLAVTQGAAGRSILTSHAETPSAYEQTFLKPNVWGQLPQIIVDSRYGFTIGNPARFGMGSYPDEHLYQAQESLDWVHGGLLVKAGFDLRHDSDTTSLLRNQTGTYYYANVENFASDALAFAAYGLTGQLDPYNQHNCDQTGKVWRDSTSTLHGLGYLPCYSYYSQSMGPTDWWLSTNDWAGYGSVQWQPKKLLVLSAGLRWEREQMPPPIARVNNPELPLTEKLPSLGNNWGPRLSLALGNKEAHWPVLRLGYGMYFGRVENAVIETALTQTGSPKGDLNFFMRPTDNLKAGGAPPFPYVFAGEPLSMVKPGAVEFAPRFRNSEVHQGEVAVEETLPGHLQVTASGLVSLGRRLPISIDTNFDPAANPGTITYAVVDATGKGPIKTSQFKVPFYASWPSATSGTGTAGRLNADYQQITQMMSRANSTYEAAMLRVSRYARRGLSLHARYTYSHAMDWNPNESTSVTGSDVLDPASFSQEYGTSNLDVRHSGSATVIWETPWKLHNLAGRLLNGWMLSGVGYFRSGMPYTMRTSGSLAKEFTATGTLIAALGPGMNGSGGDNRVYGVGRNTFRYPSTWKADMRLGKRFDLGHMRQLEFLAESFNLFNHQNMTQLETIGYYIEPGSLTGGLPTLNFMTGLKADSTAFGQPLNINATNFYRERQVQVGVRMRF
ncbi:MAG: carboxypeptidase-like regulatory domain-containing protein [Terracidiphilus sp.]|nr:carboxypeptidase-like regulatory domain-containing protein [Terracidiphilus sp.]MDR3776973.1 carboxypeptidase-like regulatory domain-containing protein [Terracidiphilus sp.]